MARDLTNKVQYYYDSHPTEAAMKQAQALAEKLRSLGINPDEV